MRPRVERLGIGFGPPIVEISVSVVFAALIIVAMRDFVANDRADAAVIYSVPLSGRKTAAAKCLRGKQFRFAVD